MKACCKPSPGSEVKEWAALPSTPSYLFIMLVFLRYSLYSLKSISTFQYKSAGESTKEYKTTLH